MESRRISFLNLVAIVDGRAVPGMTIDLFQDICSHLMGRQVTALEANHVSKCIRAGVVRPIWAAYVMEQWERTLHDTKGDFLAACEIAAYIRNYDIINFSRDMVKKIDEMPPFDLPEQPPVKRVHKIKAWLRRMLRYLKLY